MSKLTQGVRPPRIERPVIEKTIRPEDSWISRFINLPSGEIRHVTNNRINVFILRHMGTTGTISLSLESGVPEQRAFPGQSIAIARPFLFNEVFINTTVAASNIKIVEAIVENPVEFIIPSTSVANVSIEAASLKDVILFSGSFSAVSSNILLNTPPNSIPQVVESLYICNIHTATSNVSITHNIAGVIRHILRNSNLDVNTTHALGYINVPQNSFLNITVNTGAVDIILYGR